MTKSLTQDTNKPNTYTVTLITDDTISPETMLELFERSKETFEVLGPNLLELLVSEGKSLLIYNDRDEPVGEIYWNPNAEALDFVGSSWGCAYIIAEKFRIGNVSLNNQKKIFLSKEYQKGDKLETDEYAVIYYDHSKKKFDYEIKPGKVTKFLEDMIHYTVIILNESLPKFKFLEA